MTNPVPSNPVPVTGLGIRIAKAQPKETSNESVLCIKEEASQSSSAVITVSDKDGSDDFHVTNDFDLVSVEGCDYKTQKNQTTKFVPNSSSSSPVQEEKKIGFAGHYSLSNRLIQPKGDMGISTLNQTISRCEPARTRTQIT